MAKNCSNRETSPKLNFRQVYANGDSYLTRVSYLKHVHASNVVYIPICTLNSVAFTR